MRLDHDAVIEAAYIEWLGLGAGQYQARQGLFIPRGDSLSIARQAINTCPGCQAWSHGAPGHQDWIVRENQRRRPSKSYHSQ